MVVDPKMDSPLMEEEIFGPILPIVEYENEQDVITWINDHPRPLTVYYYGNPSSKFCHELKEKTYSGSFVTNDAVFQFFNADIPFGGIGNSGMGACHGKAGFEQMSNLKAYLIRPNSTFLDLPVRYPIEEEAKRLRQLKGIGHLYGVYAEDVFKWVKRLLVPAAIGGGLFGCYLAGYRVKFEFSITKELTK